MKILITTTVSSNFIEDFYKLYQSISQYNQNFQILCEFVNINEFDKTVLKKLKNLKCIFTSKEFHNYEQLKGYCTNRRIYLLNKAFVNKMKFDYFLYTDANSICVGQIDKYLKTKCKKDITLFSAEKDLINPDLPKTIGPLGTNYYGLIKGGFIILKNNLSAKKFIEKVKHKLKNYDLLWFADQESLSLVYINYKNQNIIEVKDFFDIWEKKNDFFLVRKSVSSSDLYDYHSNLLNKLINNDKYLMSINNYTNNRRIKKIEISITKKVKFFFYRLNKLSIKNIFIFYLSKFLNKNISLYKINFGKLFLNNNLKDINRVLIFYGSREEDKCYLISKLLRKGDHVIDCGSNIGYFPQIESNIVGKSGKLILIEPDSRNLMLLKRNISFLLPKIKLYENIISNKKSVVNFLETKESNLSRVVGNNSKFNSKKIKSITFKDIVNSKFLDLKKLKLIRMDIEGYEVEVVKSIIDNLQHFNKLNILIEIHPEIIINDNKMEIFINHLKTLIHKGFYFKYLVESFDKNKIPRFNLLNINIAKTLNTDNYYRNLYENIPSNEAFQLIREIPKQVRYICLSN